MQSCEAREVSTPPPAPADRLTPPPAAADGAGATLIESQATTPASVQERARATWSHRERLLEAEVARLYAVQRGFDVRSEDELNRLVQVFLSLPGEWPPAPGVNISDKELLQAELMLLQERLHEGCQHSVTDAWVQPLELVKLLPFPLACFVRFARKCGFAEGFVRASVEQPGASR